MVNQNLQLSQLVDCFEGIVPAMVCTHDSNLVPNLSYLSHVEFLDETHLALSNQFFSKTKQNVLQNGKALIVVYHPHSFQTYELRARFVRSEFSGELFERMALRIAVIAGNDGMKDVFKLLSADVYQIESIRPRLESVRRPVALPDRAQNARQLSLSAATRGLLDTISSGGLSWEQKIEATERTLRYGLGLKWVRFYQPSESGTMPELAPEHVSIVSKVFVTRKFISLGGLQLQRRYLGSANRGAELTESVLARQMSLPVVSHGKVWGVWVIEDEKTESWDPMLVESVRMICSALAMGLDSGVTPSRSTSASVQKLEFRFDRPSEVLFLNQSALLKSLPAKIFYYILAHSGSRAEQVLSNQEIIRALAQDFPVEGKANFEARLALIRKRLLDQAVPLRLVPFRRGHFKLVTEPGVEVSVLDPQ